MHLAGLVFAWLAFAEPAVAEVLSPLSEEISVSAHYGAFGPGPASNPNTYISGQFHTGTDLRAEFGTKVYAPIDGTIVYYHQLRNTPREIRFLDTFFVLRGDDRRDYVLAHVVCLVCKADPPVGDLDAYPPSRWKRVAAGELVGTVADLRGEARRFGYADIVGNHLHIGSVEGQIVDDSGRLKLAYRSANWSRLLYDKSEDANPVSAIARANELRFVDPLSLILGRTRSGETVAPSTTLNNNVSLATNGAAPRKAQTTNAIKLNRPSESLITLTPENTVDVWTTSVYSYSGKSAGPGGGKDDGELRVGGWGDTYVSLIRFPVSAQKIHRAWLEMYNRSGESSPTPVRVAAIQQPWDFPRGERLWWARRPAWTDLSEASVQVPNEGWVRLDVTSWYRDVLEGRRSNHGLAILPVETNNRHDRFVSSDSPDEHLRPRLVLEGLPQESASRTDQNPAAFVEALYADLRAGGKRWLRELSPDFSDVFHQVQRRDARTGHVTLDYDAYCQCQDTEELQVRAVQLRLKDRKTFAIVTLRKFALQQNELTRVVLELEPVPGGWKIADIIEAESGSLRQRMAASVNSKKQAKLRPVANPVAPSMLMPAFRKGSPYTQVRQVLLIQGWTPLALVAPGQCGPSCPRVPEVLWCAGAGAEAPCTYAWRRAEKYVMVEGHYESRPQRVAKMIQCSGFRRDPQYTSVWKCSPMPGNIQK